LVTNVRPRLSAARKRPWSSVGPTRANTRTSPGGPRSEAKLGNASVPAPAGMRKPQFKSRYHTADVAR
jgi:hypothetical protein